METNSVSEDTTCSSFTVVKNENKISEKKKLTPRKILRIQLKELEQKNCELENLLTLKDNEIVDLKKHVNSLNEIITSAHEEDLGRGSTIATSKIIGLSRKNRHLTAELERYKWKYEQAEAKILKLQVEPEKEKKEVVRKETRDSVRKVPSNVEALQEQLQTSKQKIFDLLNQNIELKNSLKLAQKCIQQEIGENVNLNILAQSNSNWRGRAQQIIALQSKISELKEKLESRGPEDVYKQQIRQIEAKKRMDIGELTKKISELELTAKEQKTKIAALKIRNKNLTDDAMNYKLKTLNLMEQSGHDNNSLAETIEKINIMKYQYDHKCKEFNEKIADLMHKLDEKEMENGKAKAEIENVKQIVVDKETIISGLHDTIKQLEDEMRTLCGDFLFSCKDLKKDEFVGILNALESEKKNLLEHNKTLRERFDSEHEKYLNLSEQCSKQKLKIVRLEARIREMQKEQDLQHEKRKRTQRIADYANNLSSRLSSFWVENSNNAGIINSKSEVEVIGDKFEFEEIKDKLELANEKISFLEEKLNRVNAEREQDMRMFTATMNNSKQILLSTIHENRRLDFNFTDRSVEKLDTDIRFCPGNTLNSLVFSSEYSAK